MKLRKKPSVGEYWIGEGAIRFTGGSTLDRRGKPMTMKLKGMLEFRHALGLDSAPKSEQYKNIRWESK